VYENEDQLLIVADVPGVPTDGFNLSFENGTLRLEAKRPAASGEHAAPALAREYEEVDYAATFRVPAAIDTAQIAAESKAGTILIRLPKAAAAKPRKITVS
jgi:HSP20 family molecular chaperone IbpA